MPYYKRKKNKHIFLPSCPCSCPSAVSSSVDLRGIGHNTGRPESCCTRQLLPSPSTHTVSLQKMTQQRSGCWMALSNSILPASCIHLPSHCCLLPYLPVWSTSLTIWISACLHFSPPTLPASLLSLVPFWLPASTLPNTQPSYLPPKPPPYAAALLPYPNHLISYPPSVQLLCSSFLSLVHSPKLPSYLCGRSDKWAFLGSSI